MKRNGVLSCDGNYGDSGTQKQVLSSRCALSEQGIQYWDIIPKVFHLDAQTNYQPCPFAGSAYQWMRNLVVAYKVGRQKNKQSAFVIVYAEHPALSMAEQVKSEAWVEFAETVRQEHVSLHVRSYQEILLLAEEISQQGCVEQALWRELREWVERKMAVLNGSHRKPTKKRASPSNLSIATRRNG